MSEKLKSCPFCGEKPRIELYKDWVPSYGFVIRCCHMINYDKSYDSKYYAIKAWNRRKK